MNKETVILALQVLMITKLEEVHPTAPPIQEITLKTDQAHLEITVVNERSELQLPKETIRKTEVVPTTKVRGKEPNELRRHKETIRKTEVVPTTKIMVKERNELQRNKETTLKTEVVQADKMNNSVQHLKERILRVVVAAQG